MISKSLFLNFIFFYSLPALFYIIGVGVWGDRSADYVSTFSYPAMFDLISAFLAIAGGIFLCIEAASGGGGKTSPA